MRDVYPASHWAVRGEAPGFDTPDEDVYLDGRNIVLLSKASVFMAARPAVAGDAGPARGQSVSRCDAAASSTTMARALSIGLAWDVAIETPLAALHKADVIARGAALGVPFELTLSCMQPVDGHALRPLQQVPRAARRLSGGGSG